MIRITVEVLRLEHPALVEVTHRPGWFARLVLRRRVTERYASPLCVGSNVWCWGDHAGRVVDDETAQAIADAVTVAQMERAANALRREILRRQRGSSGVAPPLLN